MFKMEKHIRRQDSDLQFNRNIPGCFWSILHSLDYHPWHNVKKMLPHRKHSRSKGVPTTTLHNHHFAKAPEHFNNESEPLLCSAESILVDEISREAHVNVMITEEMSKKGGQKYWKLNFNPKRRLLRTYSIHHLKPSDYVPGNTSKIGDGAVTSPMNNVNHSVTGVCTSLQKTHEKRGASGSKDTMNGYFGHRKISLQSDPFSEGVNGVKETLETNQMNRDSSSHPFKEDADILEIFKANKKLFAELLQGAYGKQYFEGLPNSRTTNGLAKSRSFPAAGLARNRKRKLSSLQHKQIDSFPKGKKSVSGPEPSKQVESESPKNSQIKITPFESAIAPCHNMEQQTSSSSLGPNHGLKHGGWNQLVIRRFNFIKQKLRHAFREKKKGKNHKSAKEISSTVPSDHELPVHGQDTEESLEITTSKDGTGIVGVKNMSRIASLNASLERYARLYEYNLNGNREANLSESLKLRNEDGYMKSESARKSFGRNLSMPDIDLFCSLFNDPHEFFHTALPIRTLADPKIDSGINTDPSTFCLLTGVDRSAPDTESKNMIAKCDLNIPICDSGCLNVVENDDRIAQPDELKDEIAYLDSLGGKDPGSECRFNDVGELSPHVQIKDLETFVEDDATSSLQLPDSEGAKLNPECSTAIEFKLSDDQPNNSRTLPAFETMINHDIAGIEKACEALHQHSESYNTINNADFDYMRYILQVSSFIESDHSTDRPSNPSFFDGLEACFYNKLECYWKKVEKNSDHQLLLDLVYETLHSVFERSFICFLKTFSLKCQIRPMPLGQYLLEEVREKVSWYLCLGPELDQSLDDVVVRDLGKGDDWMNLQSETECLALEMEDLILDELLDEVIFC